MVKTGKQMAISSSDVVWFLVFAILSWVALGAPSIIVLDWISHWTHSIASEYYASSSLYIMFFIAVVLLVLGLKYAQALAPIIYGSCFGFFGRALWECAQYLWRLPDDPLTGGYLWYIPHHAGECSLWLTGNIDSLCHWTAGLAHVLPWG